MSVAIIPDFVKYQTEWLTSHKHLEFEPVIEDAIVEMLKDTGKSFIDEQHAETAQADHIADIDKKVDMMHEYIYKIVQDCDGVNCYIKQGNIIRCKDCKYRYLDGMIWNCPFGLSGGEDFFCAYGAIGGGSGT